MRESSLKSSLFFVDFKAVGKYEIPLAEIVHQSIKQGGNRHLAVGNDLGITAEGEETVDLLVI